METFVEIHCKYDELVRTKNLKNHPKNRNKHGQDQIDRLAELYKYHGVRHPIIVSKLSGFIVAGHGRKLAAIRAGLDEFPVVYQDFQDELKEYAFLQADNAIADWAFLDIGEVKLDLKEFNADFDLNLLGIKNFTLDLPSEVSPEQELVDMPEFDQKDKQSFRHIIVHFNSNEDAEEFAKLIGQQITEKTKSIWHPKQENMDSESKRYG